MRKIDNFSIHNVRPDSDKETFGFSFEDYVLFDFENGYLWLWNNIPKYMIDADGKGKLIIDGVDEMGWS